MDGWNYKKNYAITLGELEEKIKQVILFLKSRRNFLFYDVQGNFMGNLVLLINEQNELVDFIDVVLRPSGNLS